MNNDQFCERRQRNYLNSLINKMKQNPLLIFKGKAIPIQAWTRPESSRRLRNRDFQTICTWRWLGCPSYAKAAITQQEISLVIIPVTGRVNNTDIEPSDWLPSYIWETKIISKKLELNFSSEHWCSISVMILIAW